MRPLRRWIRLPRQSRPATSCPLLTAGPCPCSRSGQGVRTGPSPGPIFEWGRFLIEGGATLIALPLPPSSNNQSRFGRTTSWRLYPKPDNIGPDCSCRAPIGGPLFSLAAPTFPRESPGSVPVQLPRLPGECPFSWGRSALPGGQGVSQGVSPKAIL